MTDDITWADHLRSKYGIAEPMLNEDDRDEDVEALCAHTYSDEHQYIWGGQH